MGSSSLSPEIGYRPSGRWTTMRRAWGAGGRAEAVRMMDAWIAREPKLSAARAEKGWLLHQAGDLPQAQAVLQEALELDPHDPRALTELGLVYEAMQRPERAVVLYERVLA